MCCDIVVLL
jgi:hypothetical protein